MLKRGLSNLLYCYLIALLIDGDSRGGGGGGGQRQASRVMPNIGLQATGDLWPVRSWPSSLIAIIKSGHPWEPFANIINHLHSYQLEKHLGGEVFTI